MGRISQITSKLASKLKKFSVVTKPVFTPKLKTSKTPLLNFNTGNLDKSLKTVYEVKPGMTIPVNPQTLHLKNPAFPIDGLKLKAGDEAHLSELGNLALRLEADFSSKTSNVEKYLKSMFPDSHRISVRSKSANSIHSKFIKRLKHGGTITTDASSKGLVLDGIGGRVYMDVLTPKDVTECISSARYFKRALTNEEKNIMVRFFRGDALTKSEKKFAREVAPIIKQSLAERQMEPYFKSTMASAIKMAIQKGITTPEKLRAAGVREDLIELAKSRKIKPAEIIDVNNYSGVDGTTFYSNRQIRQFEAFQQATGQDFEIISCPTYKRRSSKLSKLESDAIKEGGYTRGQITMKTADGTVFELQFAVSDFPELEHLKYDLSTDKNTIPKVAEPYSKALRSLSDYDSKRYNHFMKNYYNYDRDIGLGICAKKPVLPKGLDDILSIESLEEIHNAIENGKKLEMKNFVPGFRQSRRVQIA